MHEETGGGIGSEDPADVGGFQCARGESAEGDPVSVPSLPSPPRDTLGEAPTLAPPHRETHGYCWVIHGHSRNTHGVSRDTRGHSWDTLAILGSTASTPAPLGVGVPMVRPQHKPHHPVPPLSHTGTLGSGEGDHPPLLYSLEFLAAPLCCPSKGLPRHTFVLEDHPTPWCLSLHRSP